MVLFSTRKVFNKEEASATQGRGKELQQRRCVCGWRRRRRCRESIQRFLKENITLILFFFLEWKVLHPLLWDRFYEPGLLKPALKEVNTCKKNNTFSLGPRGGFHISTTVSLVLAQLERLIIKADVTSLDLKCCPPQTLFNNIRVGNKVTISAEISPTGVKRGQRSDLRQVTARLESWITLHIARGSQQRHQIWIYGPAVWHTRSEPLK